MTAESLHRHGQLLRERAKNHDGVFLSWGLREKLAFKLFDMADFSRVMSTLTTDLEITKQFGFTSHVSMVALHDGQALRGCQLAARKGGVYALPRAMFYK